MHRIQFFSACSYRTHSPRSKGFFGGFDAHPLLLRTVLVVLLAMAVVAKSDCAKGQDDKATRTASLELKIQFKGLPPKLPMIDTSRDPACLNKRISNDALLIDKNGGIQNVLLIWDERRNRKLTSGPFPAVKKKTIEAAFKNCQFSPRVIVARTGQELVIRQSKETSHNANVSFLMNPSSGLLVPAGSDARFQLRRPEPAPIPVTCNIHPWEKAWLVVKDHPFVGVSDRTGKLTIEGMPVGKTFLRFFHEVVDPKKKSDFGLPKAMKLNEEGRIFVDLKPGMNRLGTLTLTHRHLKADLIKLEE